MSIKKTLSDYPEISFIDNISLESIQDFYLDAMKEKYHELTGKELVMKEADPMRLIAYADCLLLYQVIQYADRAGKLSLLKYSYGDYLENIGALKGIERLQGASAVTKLRFTLSMRRNNVVVIPAGTRVTAGDGTYFETSDSLEISAGSLYGEVHASCRVMGEKGNGYRPGELKVLVDPVPYVAKVENLTVTEGGADLETDENLAERIFLAPSSWSTAGPDDAYKYWVKTFDAAITDVRVESETPGIVEIYFILQDGALPDEAMLEGVADYLREEGVRPLTDQVIVRAPEAQRYEISLDYYINASDRARAASIQENVRDAVREYIEWQKQKIGRDINPDQLRKLVISAGAKRVSVGQPDFQRVASSGIAQLSGDADVRYGGVEDD